MGDKDVILVKNLEEEFEIDLYGTITALYDKVEYKNHH